MLHRIRAESAASLLRSGILSLHHHQLLSTPALARQRVKSGLVSPRAGAGAAALSFCSDRICGDARARTPASDRTGAGESIIGDAGHQAGVRATCAGGLAPSRSFRSNSPWGAGRWNGGASGSRFYDLVVFSEKKRAEKLRHMHRKPVKRGLVARTGAVGVEQLSPLCV